jgi:hypothetical protein
MPASQRNLCTYVVNKFRHIENFRKPWIDNGHYTGFVDWLWEEGGFGEGNYFAEDEVLSKWQRDLVSSNNNKRAEVPSPPSLMKILLYVDASN